MTIHASEVESIPLFASLDAEHLRKVQAIAREVEVRRRDVLFREGEPAEGIFFLVSGRVKIYKLSPDGKEHILHVIHPGQAFAEAAVFMGGGYPAYAEALQKSKAIMLPKHEFLELLRQEPSMSLKIIATLSRYLKQFADRIEDLSLKDVSARLARWFLTTAEEKGRDFWDLEITKGELASQIGTVSETLSRTLRKFQDSGWVQVRGRFVKILDRKALRSVSEGSGESGPG